MHTTLSSAFLSVVLHNKSRVHHHHHNHHRRRHLCISRPQTTCFLHRSGTCVSKNLTRCFSCRFFSGCGCDVVIYVFVGRSHYDFRYFTMGIPFLLPFREFSVEGGIFVTLALSWWSWTLGCCQMLQLSWWTYCWTTQVRGIFFHLLQFLLQRCSVYLVWSYFSVATTARFAVWFCDVLSVPWDIQLA